MASDRNEEPPVGKSYLPVTKESSLRRTKGGGGVRKTTKPLLFALRVCVAILFVGVIGGSLSIFASHDAKNDKAAFNSQLTNETSQSEASIDAAAAMTTILPPTLPPPPSGNISACSCWNTTAPPACCQRTIFRAHKFGTILVDTLFDPFRHPYSKHRIQVDQFPKLPNDSTLLPTASDYRHVVVTRNWFDAIVSGYLYHKAGYECWMNARGEAKRIVRRGDWESQLLFHHAGNISFPHRNKRSICTYLVEESEQDGMRVLMDIALSKWYKAVVPYYKAVQQRLQQDSQRHSLFVCYEHLVDPFQQERICHQVMDWLFPMGEAQNVSIAADVKRSLEEQRRNQTVYQGGHATAHDPELRARLRSLVERLDREVFNNTVASSDAIFGCGKGAMSP